MSKHHHHHHHHHHHTEDMDSRKLTWAIIINVALTIVQFLGGIFSGSLSLVADAVHNLSDAGSLVIAFVARKIAGLPSNKTMTYGYGRAEILGALINSVSLFMVALYLLYEAYERYQNQQTVDGWIIIIIASFALIIDLGTAWLTHAGSKESINMRAAFIHNLTDAAASVVVIICGTLILLYQVYWVDLLGTVLIAGYVLYHSWALIKSCIATLMQAVPEELNVDDIKVRLSKIPGVLNIHHVHLWQVHERFRSLEAHVVVSSQDLKEVESIKSAIKESLHDNFHITHSTLEFECEGINCHSH